MTVGIIGPNRITAVPTLSNASIQAVGDPQARQALRTIADMLAVRNGDIGNGSQAFLTMADLTGSAEARGKLASAIAKEIANGLAQPNRPPGPLTELADKLQAEILASAAWQSMFTRVGLIDAPDTVPGSPAYQLVQEAIKRGAAITSVQSAVQGLTESTASKIDTLTSAMGQGDQANAAAIREETRVRSGDYTAMAQRIDVMSSSIGTTVTAAVQGETTVRVNSDNALASAINTMWARVGANAALVQGGTQIAVNDVGGVLTKFEQLQATTTDPITGLVAKSAALRTDLELTNNTVSGMSGKWGVKLDLNGYITGVSLNSGVTTGGAAESSFIVVADKFAIGAPGKNSIVPFAIDARTGLVAIRGDLFVERSITANKIEVNTITAGSAIIANAAITSALIADAAITRAKIGDAQVDTLQIAGNAVTAAFSANGTWICQIGMTSLGVPLWISASLDRPTRSTGSTQFPYVEIVIKRDGNVIGRAAAQGVVEDGNTIHTTAARTLIDYPSPGYHVYSFEHANGYDPTSTIDAAMLETRR